MDFSQLEDTPLVFPIGTPIGDMQCVTVNISDDDLVEDDETFTLSLTSSDAVFLFPNSSKEVTIVNNDCKYENSYCTNTKDILKDS